MTVNRYIGASIKRVEDLRFLRGNGEYVADLAREGVLRAAVLRSPVAHGPSVQSIRSRRWRSLGYMR
jgi:aerobic carbon-monoxide dehydrogenase large subunit